MSAGGVALKNLFDKQAFYGANQNKAEAAISPYEQST